MRNDLIDQLAAAEEEYQRERNGQQPAKRERVILSRPDGEKPPVVWEPKLISFSDIEAKPINWLWRERIPLGCITAVVGRPGAGKSYFTCDLAAHITTGTDWPDGCGCSQGDVIFICAEDDPSMVIKPRLDAHGADCSRIKLLTSKVRYSEEAEPAEMMLELSDLLLIEQALKQTPDCRLIVVDPIGSYLGGSVDSYRDNEVRSILTPISKLAEKYSVAVLIVVHTRKGAAGHADDLALGSRAFIGISRAVWHVMADAEDDTRHLVLPGKSNLSARKSGLAYRLVGEPAHIQWEENPVDMSASDAMSAGQDGEEKSAIDEAVEWLSAYLADGAKPGKEIKANAKRDGISEATLKRAKRKLKIESAPDGMGGPWVWYTPIPSSVDQSISRVAHTNNVSHSDNTVSHSDKCSPIGGEFVW